jgi:hypothetical protein
MTSPDRQSHRKTAASARRISAHDSRVSDRTDYEHRYFVNLAAAAFVLALGLGIGWTIKAFDRQLALEKCLDSGRKDCRQVVEPFVRSHVSLAK